MSEILTRHGMFERSDATFETERKFVPHDPELFEQYRGYAEKDITQVYLSEPSDEYSLRVRKSVEDDETKYTATLKDRGIVTEDGLRRLEVEIPISPETFEYYAQSGNAVIRKKRAEPLPGVTVDWIDGLDSPIIEIENTGYNEQASLLLSQMQPNMHEVTATGETDNESLAYRLGGIEYGELQTLDVATVLGDIRAMKAMGKTNIVVGLAGRSGSGKTTFTRQVAQAAAQEFGGSPVVVSTDDYHVGKTHLEANYESPWTNWDLDVVYDTAELARDIERLQRQEPVRSRSFSFATQEPVQGRPHVFNPIVIVEGIHAGSRDLAGVRDIFFEVPTSLATSLGRDIARLLQKDRPNESIGTPEDRLKYMLETGEPTYRTFERPRRNRFSASVRSLGSAALNS